VYSALWSAASIVHTRRRRLDFAGIWRCLRARDLYGSGGAYGVHEGVQMRPRRHQGSFPALLDHRVARDQDCSGGALEDR